MKSNIQIKVKSNIPTVYQLRQSGHKVRVQRYRLHSTADGDPVFLDPNGYLVNSGLVSEPLPHGGLTIISIRKPSGEEVVGESRCSIDDAFVKKAGVEVAIAKALELPVPVY